MHLQNVTRDDYQFLYDLLKERPDYANISHRKMPTYEEHIKFCNSEPYAFWMIIWSEYPEESIKRITTISQAGSLYLTKDNEIGIFIKSEFQGMGLAKRAIRAMLTVNGKTKLANIAPDNTASIKLFESLGFKLIQHTYRYEG